MTHKCMIKIITYAFNDFCVCFNIAVTYQELAGNLIFICTPSKTFAKHGLFCYQQKCINVTMFDLFCNEHILADTPCGYRRGVETWRQLCEDRQPTTTSCCSSAPLS